MGRSYVDRADLAPDEYYSSGARIIQPAFEPGSMLVLTARVRWLFDFQTRNVDDGASSLCGISMF